MSTLSKIQLNLQLSAIEALAQVSTAGTEVKTEALNDGAQTLTSSTTPPVTKFASEAITLGAGATTVDFTALTDVEGNAVDATGLKLQILRLKTPATNTAVVNVAPGASNAYLIFGSGNDIDVGIKGHLLYYIPEALADVSATVKTIDVSGTSGEKIDLEFVFG
jgi:hypothetical protein